MSPKGGESKATASLATNRAARHHYHLLDRFEAGLVLTGPEVKSCREGRVNLKDAYVRVKGGEAFLLNVHVTPYAAAPRQGAEPTRPRKLLLHAREILRLARETRAEGMTIVPTRMYLKNGRIKVEIALAKGRREFDKREAARRREIETEMRRARGAKRSVRPGRAAG